MEKDFGLIKEVNRVKKEITDSTKDAIKGDNRMWYRKFPPIDGYLPSGKIAWLGKDFILINKFYRIIKFSQYK